MATVALASTSSSIHQDIRLDNPFAYLFLSDVYSYLIRWLFELLMFIYLFICFKILQYWSTIKDIFSQSIFIGNYVRGDDKETRLVRRAMARYLCLTQALVFRDIGVSVRKRFPTMNSLIQAGEFINFDIFDFSRLMGFNISSWNSTSSGI